MIVDAEVTAAGTRQEWGAGTTMLANQGTHPSMTIGAGRGYDTGDFVDGCRGMVITPHVASKSRKSCVDDRTTGTKGCRISQVKRKCIEECFGWMKDIGLLRKLRHRGQDNVR